MTVTEQLAALSEEVEALEARVGRCETARSSERTRADDLDARVTILAELVEDAKPLVAHLVDALDHPDPLRLAACDWLRRWIDLR